MNRDWWALGPERFRVRHPLRVRYNEIDAQGIVFNGNYLIYADVGVTEYFRALGEGQPGPYFHQYGTDIVVVNGELDYHASARLDEEITLGARVARFGRSSFTLHVALWRGEERLTDIALTYAHIDRDTGRATPLPASFVAEVRSFEVEAPAHG